MLDRFKQAAMVLAGYRPAEVRFDDWDRTIAGDIADGLAHQVARHHPDVPGLKDEVDMAIDQAIWDYVTWEEETCRFEEAREGTKGGTSRGRRDPVLTGGFIPATEGRNHVEVSMLTVVQAANLLGVKPGLVYSLCSGGRLRHCKIGHGRGVIRIPEDALDEYVRSVTFGTEGAKEPPSPPRRKVNLKHLRL